MVLEPIIHTGFGGIKVDLPKMMNGSDKKCRDAQKFNGQTQKMETYISFNGIDLNTEKALTMVGFRLEKQALVVFNQFKREALVKDFYTFMVYLRKHTISSTSIDLLWRNRDKANLTNSEGISIGVYAFVRVLDDLQIRLKNQKEEMTIPDKVKLRKFINTISDYMERVVKTKMIEREYIYEEIIKVAESKETVYNKDKGVNKEKKKRQYNNPAKNQIKPNISLPPQSRKLSTFPKGPSQHNNEADWKIIEKKRTPAEKMQLVREKKCLWYLNPRHRYVDCRMKKANQTIRPFRTAAQKIQERVDPKNKPNRIDKTISVQEVETNRVAVKINSNRAMALIDLQTEGCNLINAQFVHLFQIATRDLQPPLTLMTTIKGSRASINKAAEIELDWGGHIETITCCVANLSREDIIIGKPLLLKNKVVI